MQERQFIVRANGEDLEFYDDLDENYAQSICENELEIPSELIKKIECFKDAFRVHLKNSRNYYRDDWYVNLQRLEFVS
ncbi:MAG: hypothetical protein IE916_04005 [Epsilonproteobacteria bacterium]|nr:hypothetical protein [Campylobacterota bacterium]